MYQAMYEYIVYNERTIYHSFVIFLISVDFVSYCRTYTGRKFKN